MAAKKSNGHAPEFTYEPSTAPPAKTLLNLDAAAEQGQAGKYYRVEPGEACLVTPRNEASRLVLARWSPEWHRPGWEATRRARSPWRCAFAMRTEKIGAHEFVMARPMVLQLPTSVVAAAQRCFGRGRDLAAYAEGVTAEDITDQTVFVACRHNTSRGFLWVRYAGLWGCAGEWHGASAADIWLNPSRVVRGDALEIAPTPSAV